jgi:dihydrofolate reductase
MDQDRKLILYIAMSLDGYISKPHDDLSFLNRVHKEGEDYGYGEFISGVDTVILGRRTYDWVTAQVDFPHADKNAYVITRHPRPAIGNTVFYTGDLGELVMKLKKEKGKNIFCDGGAQIAQELIKKDLIDQYILSVIPVLLGAGIRLFCDGSPEQELQLISAKNYDTGLVQLHYRRPEKNHS